MKFLGNVAIEEHTYPVHRVENEFFENIVAATTKQV